MINKDLRLKLYLEGVEFPVKKVMMTITTNIQTVVQIVVPYFENINSIMDSTHCMITYLTGETDQKNPPKEIERIFFEGELTGRILSRNGINRSCTFYATDPRKYLNNMSSKYYHAFDNALNTKNVVAYLQSVAKLYDLNDSKVVNAIYGDALGTNVAHTTVGGYYDAIISLLKYSPHGVYANAEKRYSLKDSFAFLDHGKMNIFASSEKTYSLMLNKVKEFSINSGMTVFDTMSELLARYGYSFIHVASPCYSANQDEQKRDTPFYSIKRDSAMYFVIMPELMGYDPPTCNIIYTDYDDVFHANILEPKVTAFGIIPNISGVVVSDLGTCVFPKKEDKYYPDEDLIGPKRTSESEDYFLTGLIASKKVKTGDVKDRAKEKYYKLRSEGNSISISKGGFYPNLVCGLPTVVYDTVDKIFYHGIIKDISYSVDQEEGQVSTQVNIEQACVYDKLPTEQCYANIKGIQEYYKKFGFTKNDAIVQDRTLLKSYIEAYASPDSQHIAYHREIASREQVWGTLEYKNRETNKTNQKEKFMITERKVAVENAKR